MKRNYYRDAREHLAALDEKGKLLKIKRKVNKDAELMPLVRWQFRGLDEEERRAFLGPRGLSPYMNVTCITHRRDASNHEKRSAEMSALLINATRPWPYLPVSLPRKEFMERAKVLREEMGLPQLKPRMPWYGYSLGVWSKEDEEEAELALRGDHFITGDKARSRRTQP